MAELFADQDRLDDLLKEVPKELTAKLRQARQVQSKVARQLPGLERKRAEAEKLTEQIRKVLEELKEKTDAAEEGLEAELESATNAASAAAETLKNDAEGVVSEIDGIEGAADTLRTSLGGLAGRSREAADTAVGELSGLESEARSGMSAVGAAGDQVRAATEELAAAVDGARESVAGAVGDLSQRITELVSNADQGTSATVSVFGQMADQHRASLDGLSGRLGAWTSATAETIEERLAGEVESPLTERLAGLPNLFQALERVLSELTSDTRTTGDELSGGFSSLSEHSRGSRQLAEQVVQLAESLNV